jgi:Protein of unknown function (DUF2934)
MMDRRQRIRERAYEFWKEEAGQDGNDLAHWFRAEAETPPIRITFDSNSWQPIVSPDKFAKDPRHGDFLKIRVALQQGDIQGFISETVTTLEAIQKTDRANYFSSQRVRPKFSIEDRPDGTIKIDMRIAPDDSAHSGLTGVLSDRLRLAAEVQNMRLLRAPRIGLPRPKDIDIEGLFAVEAGEAEILQRQSRASEAGRAIEARSVGFAQVKLFGEGIAARLKQKGPWYQFLDRPKDQEEANKIIKAVAEWADGDSVTAHIAYRNDFLCTEDRGKAAGGSSVFDARNRAWLETTYGVKFVSLSELAATVET